ncbi:outer membrane protein assembly factor BamC [Cardiobacteriaceae bacterium TAE3-ERU3]|nr:outer membrane protein assembly factor BamC [Cardiobacteriaceae bacterium TAE3-ERU3]
MTIALGLTACGSGGNLSEIIPDRRPDYRTSSLENSLEVPPDLLGATIDSQYNIPDLNPSAIANYNAYTEERVQRNQRGMIEVLPPLEGVDVIEQNGQLPYIVINAPAEVVWRAVKRYWNQNGIRLAVEEPSIGIMETDWLLNQADLPSTGLGGLLDSLLGFVSDTGERDRYRIRFARNDVGQTVVTLVYTQSVEKAEYEGMSKKEIAGYTWQITDNDNPELQLEMTRRLAIYIANELRRQDQVSNDQIQQTGATRFVELGQLQNGNSALIFNGSYDQAWRALAVGLDNASFAIQDADFNNGAYRVQYQPQSQAQADPGLWDKLWGNSNQATNYDNQPIYLVRLADQGDHSIALVQNADGSNASPAQATQILEAIYATM